MNIEETSLPKKAAPNGIPPLEHRMPVSELQETKDQLTTVVSQWLDQHSAAMRTVKRIGDLEHRRVVVTLQAGVTALPEVKGGDLISPDSLAPLEQKIGIQFLDKQLLAQALTHRSALRGVVGGKERSNERLEFLGDAVLELVVTEWLFSEIERNEGELTSWRSSLVKGEHLQKVARELDLGSHLLMSRGEEADGGREKASLLANVVEAIIGAIYLDQGFEKARQFIYVRLMDRLRQLIAEGGDKDTKSRLQEIAQARLSITPTYRVIDAQGPDNDKFYTVVACLGAEEVAEGSGKSKRRAELEAAANTLKIKGW